MHSHNSPLTAQPFFHVFRPTSAGAAADYSAATNVRNTPLRFELADGHQFVVLYFEPGKNIDDGIKFLRNQWKIPDDHTVNIVWGREILHCSHSQGTHASHGHDSSRLHEKQSSAQHHEAFKVVVFDPKASASAPQSVPNTPSQTSSSQSIPDPMELDPQAQALPRPVFAVGVWGDTSPEGLWKEDFLQASALRQTPLRFAWAEMLQEFSFYFEGTNDINDGITFFRDKWNIPTDCQVGVVWGQDTLFVSERGHGRHVSFGCADKFVEAQVFSPNEPFVLEISDPNAYVSGPLNDVRNSGVRYSAALMDVKTGRRTSYQFNEHEPMTKVFDHIRAEWNISADVELMLIMRGKQLHLDENSYRKEGSSGRYAANVHELSKMIEELDGIECIRVAVGAKNSRSTNS